MQSNTVHPMITSATLQSMRQSPAGQTLRQEMKALQNKQQQEAYDKKVDQYFLEAKHEFMKPNFEQELKKHALENTQLKLLFIPISGGEPTFCGPCCCCDCCIATDFGNSKILEDVAAKLKSDPEVSQRIPAGATFTIKSSYDYDICPDATTSFYLDWTPPSFMSRLCSAQMK